MALKSYLAAAPPADMGLLVGPRKVEVAGGWLVQPEEPVGTKALLSRAAFSHLPLPTGGLYDGLVTGYWGIGAFHRNVSQMEIPGGGGTSPDIPPMEVLGVVTPPEEAVIP